MTEGKRDKPGKRPATPASAGTAGGLVKLFYRIGEVAQIVGVAPHVLRYWETEFPTVKPQKSNHGQRVYTKRDVQKLLLIKHLLKDQGLTIAGARKQLRSNNTLPAPAGVASGVVKGGDDASVESRLQLDVGVPESALGPVGVRAVATLSDTAPQGASDLEREPVAGQRRVPEPSSKSMRQALLSVRRELIDWLSDLQ